MWKWIYTETENKEEIRISLTEKKVEVVYNSNTDMEKLKAVTLEKIKAWDNYGGYK